MVRYAPLPSVNLPQMLLYSKFKASMVYGTETELNAIGDIFILCSIIRRNQWPELVVVVVVGEDRN